jgi:hypothetical protein
MSQLHQFINTLNEKELSLIKGMRLIGKESALFNYILNYFQRSIPEVEDICRETNITSTHLYKINSVLLNKCYSRLVPESGFALLHYLKGKGLFVLLKSEASTQEKIHLRDGFKTADKEKFYLSLFHLYIDFPFKYYDKKSVEKWGEKYIIAKSGVGDEDKLYVKFHLLFSEVNKCAAQKNPLKALGKNSNDLLAYEKELGDSKHYLARYYLYRSIVSYYTYYEKNAARIEEYLKKCIALKDKIQFFFPINVGQFLNLLYADHLFSNQRTDEAWVIFKKEFDAGVEPDIYGYHYHCEQYILLCIIKAEYAKAKDLLDKVFHPLIELRVDILATRGCLAYAKYYLTQLELKLATHYINMGRNINEKALYLPFDLQLRLLENIHFYLKEDYEFCYRLANRNIKFVQSQKEKKLFDDYLQLFRIIIMHSQLKRGKIRHIDQQLLAEQKRIGESYRNYYCNLILDL